MNCDGTHEAARRGSRLWLAGIVLATATGFFASGRLATGADLADRYVLVNLHKSEVQEPVFAQLAEMAADRAKAAPQLGVGVIISYFAQSPQQSREQLRRSLDLAERFRLPIIVQLDGEQWWQARPDLWNWWDPSQPGYDAANANHVEWSGWGPEFALKLAWRNWGRQIRVLPPPNLMSPRYRQACHAAMAPLVKQIIEWFNSLPAEQQHLLAGVKVGWESSLGTNAYYYPNGNALLSEDPANDPVEPLQPDALPGRGFQPTGYAAVKTAGLADGGDLQEADMAEVVRRHLADLARVVRSTGLPRERIFTHCGGWKEGERLYGAALNDDSCPGWSIYRHATDPRQDRGVMEGLAASEAPYWAAVEWLPVGAKTSDQWAAAISATLSIERCRYLCIYNWRGIADNSPALDGMRRTLKCP